MISVIMPVKNGEKYLNESIDSIVNQTYPDWELIIIDDGSKDLTIEIVKKYSDSRIKLYRSPGKGISDALNFGIEKSSGNYIARMDADDISLKDRFEKSIDTIKRTNADIVTGYVYKIDEKDKIIGNFIKYHSMSEIQLVLPFTNPIVHPSVLIKKDLFVDNKYDSKYNGIEDYELWTRILCTKKIHIIKDYILKYRISASSYSIRNRKKQIIRFTKLSKKRFGYIEKKLNNPFYLILFIINRSKKVELNLFRKYYLIVILLLKIRNNYILLRKYK